MVMGIERNAVGMTVGSKHRRGYNNGQYEGKGMWTVGSMYRSKIWSSMGGCHRGRIKVKISVQSQRNLKQVILGQKSCWGECDQNRGP